MFCSPDCGQMSTFNCIVKRCEVVVRVLLVNIATILLDQYLDNVIMTIDGSNLHGSPTIFGHSVGDVEPIL